MTDVPVVLGINRTQDASACLMQGSHLLWAIQKERVTRHKHHWGGPGDVRDHYGPRLPWPERPLDIVVECFSSDDEVRDPARYDDELHATLRLAPGGRRARISHHLAHLVSAFHPSPFRDAAVMVIDGQDSPVAELTAPWSGAAYVPGNWREVASFYRADRERVHCIGKQLWDRDDTHLVGLGMFYFLLTQAIFPGEGKVMGLAPHGVVHALGLPPLDVEGRLRQPGGGRPTRVRGRHPRRGPLAACENRTGQPVLRRRHGAELFRQRTPAAGNAVQAGLHSARAGRCRHRTGCALYGLAELAGTSCAYRWTYDYLATRRRHPHGRHGNVQPAWHRVLGRDHRLGASPRRRPRSPAGAHHMQCPRRPGSLIRHPR